MILFEFLVKLLIMGSNPLLQKKYVTTMSWSKHNFLKIITLLKRTPPSMNWDIFKIFLAQCWGRLKGIFFLIYHTALFSISFTLCQNKTILFIISIIFKISPCKLLKPKCNCFSHTEYFFFPNPFCLMVKQFHLFFFIIPFASWSNSRTEQSFF